MRLYLARFRRDAGADNDPVGRLPEDHLALHALFIGLCDVAVWQLGSRARPASPAPLAALPDKNRHVRVAAGLALKKVDPEAATKAKFR